MPAADQEIGQKASYKVTEKIHMHINSHKHQTRKMYDHFQVKMRK
jgi:hypothetical protein